MSAKNLYRIEEEGTYSHIYNKGVEKRTIFNDEEDYKVFLGYLNDYLTTPKDPDSIKKSFKVHGRTFRGTPHQPKNYFNKVELVAYSLMPDRFHLLLHQKTRGSIEKFIRSLCTRYSMYFNKKYERSGALFEGPYKSTRIENHTSLLLLTRHLHHTGSYSSYPEYLGERETLWVKSKIAKSLFDKEKTELFKGTHSYKDFVEKYEPDQDAKKLIESMGLEGIDLARDQDIYSDLDLKPRPRVAEFLAISAAVFLLLVTVGIRNIKVSTAKNLSLSQAPSVLSETDIKNPGLSQAPSISKTEKIMLTVQIISATASKSASVSIREEPSTDSAKLGKARNGDTFEFVSKNQGWYEVKLADGSTGFISAKYIKGRSK